MTESLLDYITDLTVGDIIDADDPVTLLRSAFGPDAIQAVAADLDLETVPLVLLRWNEQWHCLTFIAHSLADEGKFWSSPADRPRIFIDALAKPLGGSASDVVALVGNLMTEDEEFRDFQDGVTESVPLHFIRLLLRLHPDEDRREMHDAINASDPGVLGDLYDEALWEDHVWEPAPTVWEDHICEPFPTGNPRASLGSPDLLAPLFAATLGDLAAATEPGPLILRLYGNATTHTEHVRREDLETDEVHVLLAHDEKWHFLYVADEYDYDWRTPSVRSTLLLTALANPWKDPIEVGSIGNLTAAQSLARYHANFTANVGISDWTSLAFLRLLLDRLPDEERETVQTMLALSHTGVAASL